MIFVDRYEREGGGSMENNNELNKSYEELIALITKNYGFKEKYKAAINIKCTQDFVEALQKASDASEAQAESLKRATWVLAFVTLGLFIATVISAYFSWCLSNLS